MSKYGFVNKPIKTTEAEWDRIFNPHPSKMRQIEYADMLKDPVFGRLSFPEDGEGLPSVYNVITGEWFEVLSFPPAEERPSYAKQE